MLFSLSCLFIKIYSCIIQLPIIEYQQEKKKFQDDVLGQKFALKLPKQMIIGNE